MKFVCLCILFLGNLVTGRGVEALSSPLFVSLGGYCEVAAQLRKHNLREEAYPFDWILSSSHEKFLEILNEDFQFFLDENYIFQNSEHPFILENRRYECEFRHDWPVKFESGLSCHLQEIASKYERRIARFRKLRDYSGKVFFIRAAYDSKQGGIHYWWNDSQERITAGQAKTLKMALDQFFPLLDFTLIIINYEDEKLEKIDVIDGVIEFKIRREFKALEFTELFHRLYERSKVSRKDSKDNAVYWIGYKFFSDIIKC
ncbi:MAG: DUF1796 family putative cysteine peptidase [Chlamydiales bacterium]|nr:DUF1796 family putative cysteine peptidase [Chlamydiales bacterium]